MIEIVDLRLQQGAFVLEVPHLSLKKGELVAICGNNGSGKSTFLSTLSGLKDFSGDYRLNGKDFRKLGIRERARHISFLPQQSTLSMPFEVFYVVLTGRFSSVGGKGYTPEDYRKVEEVLRLFDLHHLKDRPFHELSGGERQRVLLARAFVREAEVILLDEPFTAVDLKHQHRLLKFFRQISRRSILLAVMHDLSLAFRYFDRFLFFKGGRLVFDLKREELCEKKLSRVFEIDLKLLRYREHYLVEVTVNSDQ
jgi:iron complex transport system ATP-binding protein